MFDVVHPFYEDVCTWVRDNSLHTFYVYSARQDDVKIYTFCAAVLDVLHYASPIIITNVGPFDGEYPIHIRAALALSKNVRVYESAKMSMNIVLRARAKTFIDINGGVLWIQ